jgi:hypothetical protein
VDFLGASWTQRPLHDAAPSEHIATALAPVTKTPDADAGQNGQPVQEIMISDDPQRSTIVLLPNASGLPYPVFVNPHYARVLGSLAAAEWLPGITRSLYGGWPLGKPGSLAARTGRRMGDRDDSDRPFFSDGRGGGDS